MAESRDKLLKIERALKKVDHSNTYDKLQHYKPYPKQKEFHANGATFRERLLSAGNQNGKTFCGAAETAMHLTGRYPDWWKGRRWNRPVSSWVAGVTGESTRDNPQRLLCGRLKDGWGTGLIPHETVRWGKGDTTSARGVSDLFDTVLVDHVSGGKSQVQFKSYERGREKWQGDTLDFLWFDEEPPEDIYAEGLTRTAATGGMTFITFTPLNGWTEVVEKFFRPKDTDPGAKNRALTQMTIDDAEHIPLAQREIVIAGFLPHEREARKNGVPMLGSGKIFQTVEEELRVDPFPIPNYWRLIWGIDFGIDHPFAAVLMAWDTEADKVYVINTVRMSDALPLAHAAAMKGFKQGGAMAPVAWPQDGHVRKEYGGLLLPTAKIYKAHGLRMMGHHATFPDGSNSTEAGIMQMTERMTTGRFKVFATQGDWFDEYRTYHRKEGQIVKLRDDLMSATRVAIMALRAAQSVLFDPVSGQGGGPPQQMARGLDFDLFQT